jgi:long-subunit fatty acid transport protein
VSSQQANQTDVNTFTLALGATYQIFPLTKLFGSYTFLYQRTGGASSSQVDVDQNRVRFGVQLGYPINFD